MIKNGMPGVWGDVMPVVWGDNGDTGGAWTQHMAAHGMIGQWTTNGLSQCLTICSCHMSTLGLEFWSLGVHVQRDTIRTQSGLQSC